MTERRKKAVAALTQALIDIAHAAKHLDGEIGQSRDVAYYDINGAWHAVDAVMRGLQGKRRPGHPSTTGRRP